MHIWRSTITVALLASSLASAGDYPAVVLRTDRLRATVYTPDADKGFYRGSRFDWSGVLGEVEFAGHKLFTPWLTGKHAPTFHSAILGPVEEFGTEKPLGYAETEPGGTFLKIGVGELRKAKDEPYSALRDYAVAVPGKWTVDREGDRSLRFTQEVRTASGYAYRYEKTVTLRPPATLSIAHRLRNVGDKPIETDVYNHNFFNVDGDPVGPNYAIAFPFAPAADAPKERFAEIVELAGKELRFRKPLDTGSVYAGLTGFDRAAKPAFTLRHAKSGVRVDVEGTAPLTKFMLWGMKTTLCPEPFHAFRIEPGQEARWAWEYRFTSGE